MYSVASSASMHHIVIDMHIIIILFLCSIDPTVDIESDNNPFYDHLDTIKDVHKTANTKYVISIITLQPFKIIYHTFHSFFNFYIFSLQDMHLATYVATFNSYNTGMSVLPDMHTQIPEGCRPEG